MKPILPVASMVLCSLVLGCRSESDHAQVKDGSKSGSLFGLVSDDDDEDGEEQEVDVALADIPAAVRAAALAAVPGLVIEEAELEGSVYDIEGTANGDKVELEITADGKVLEIEHGDEDDDGDHDGDHEDEDDD